MARAKTFDVTPDPVLCILAKVLDATRDKAKLSDRDRYKDDLTPGEHRYTGTLDYDIQFTVGEQAKAARYFGTPIDSILLLAFYYSGAVREYFTRAAMIVRELRSAELEKRPIRAVSYTFQRIVEGQKDTVAVNVTIPAAEVLKEAERIAGKLVGVNPEDTALEQQKRELMQQQIADCLGKLKVERVYDGPINITEPHLEVHSEHDDQAIAA